MQIKIHERNGGLVVLCQHNIFRTPEEIEQDLAYPQQCLTIDTLRQGIECLIEAGYRFISPLEILTGLDPKGKHALLTFDDGYYNNTLALPLMERYNVPAIFFVPAYLMQESRAGWWDVLFRLRVKQGKPRHESAREVHTHIATPVEQIEAALEKEPEFSGFQFLGEIDRFFTPDELREFSTHPLVHIGNHTWKHEYLTSYPIDEVERRIILSQKILKSITGKLPISIAYPCGVWTGEIANVCQKAGIQLGFTTQSRKNYVPGLGKSTSLMEIGRFILRGNKPIRPQCDFMRSDLMLHARFIKATNILRRVARSFSY